MQTTLVFESRVAASAPTAWTWITSLEGISKEMAPLLRMSAPRGVHDLGAIPFQSGVPMFRSWLLLGGVLPIDYSDLTLVALTPGVGFVEQSRMGSMRLWRHVRRIDACESGCRITDTLTFEPRFCSQLVVAFVRRFFAHRHQRLGKYLGG